MTTPMTTDAMAAAATLASEGEPNPLIPHLSELIVGLVAFALLYFFLARKLFPIFERVYRERREAIQGGIEHAEQVQAEAQQTLEQYQQQMAEARHEASRLREEARVQGTQIIAEMREQAQSEARRITEAAQQQIEAERQQALLSLRTQVGRLAVDLAERIVGEALTEEDRQRRLIDRFLSEVEEDARSSGDGVPALDSSPTGATAYRPEQV